MARKVLTHSVMLSLGVGRKELVDSINFLLREEGLRIEQIEEGEEKCYKGVLEVGLVRL